MPTQLLCPQCRVELPGSPARDEPGECPRCKTAFAAPRVKLTKSAAKVLQSKPFTPPTATTPATLPATPPQAAPSMKSPSARIVRWWPLNTQAYFSSPFGVPKKAQPQFSSAPLPSQVPSRLMRL